MDYLPFQLSTRTEFSYYAPPDIDVLLIDHRGGGKISSQVVYIASSQYNRLAAVRHKETLLL